MPHRLCKEKWREERIILIHAKYNRARSGPLDPFSSKITF